MEIRNANANPEPGSGSRGRVPNGSRRCAASLKLIRRNAESWRVDTKRVGSMGLAGGGEIQVYDITPRKVLDFLCGVRIIQYS